MDRVGGTRIYSHPLFMLTLVFLLLSVPSIVRFVSVGGFKEANLAVGATVGWCSRNAAAKRVGLHGEMTRAGFAQFARAVGLGAADEFVDQGSGEGALVLQAARKCGVAAAAGVELSPSRHAKVLASPTGSPAPALDRVTFVCADGAGEEAAALLESATVVWDCNICFDETLYRRLAARLGAAPRVRALASLKPFPESVQRLAHLQAALLL